MDYFEDDLASSACGEYLTGYDEAGDYETFATEPGEQFASYPGETGDYLSYESLSEVGCPGLTADQASARSRSNPCGVDLGRPLKIVCLGPSFELGGVGQQTLSLANYFDRKRARMIRCLVTRGDAEGHRRLIQMGIPVERATTRRLELAAAEADVFLMWGDHFDRTLPEKRPLCVFVAHGESAWTRQGLQRSRAVIDHVIAVSERVRQKVCGGFETTTILNGIDTTRLAATRPRQDVRRELGIRADEFVVGGVGRMTREKQLERLVDAVALLPPSFKLLLVGNGSRRVELLERATDLIPGRFVITSRDEQLGDLYRAMDAFVLPSAHEGFGLVVAEAMACRRPVIATCVGAVPEIIENHLSGLIVQSSPRAFAEAVLKVSRHPKWAAGIANEAYRFALRHLNARRMASDYEALLSRLVAARTQPQGS